MKFKAMVNVCARAEDGTSSTIPFEFPVGGECPVTKLFISVVKRSKKLCHKLGLIFFEVEIQVEIQIAEEEQSALRK